MMSIAQLLQAAEYLERRERAEHGYASPLPLHDEPSRKRLKAKKILGNSRSTHNELEKNRRAHLRNCLEGLKEMVPLGPEATRHTTLGLLTKARVFIKNLEDKEKKNQQLKDQLNREHRFLKRRLEQLDTNVFRKSRKLRQDSTGYSEDSEKDEVDVLGYTSHSDSDERSSVETNGSDGGFTLNSIKLLDVQDS
uniref:Max dimerization protein 1-like isoform X2 n=1 Tax=Saccoglossus kowalevskii TaxID=10224 RepID=A0ABM0MJ48_SACKO|nr:PREDICTED: max dimerization protein 1-like isoform X2 [Saccoglossus kowalevskii]